MASQSSARIVGLGSYLPQKILSNSDLEKMVETSDEWITSRTGMKERRIASAEETTSYMATQAGKEALEKAHCTAKDVDLILVATMSGDYITPSTSALVQASLGCENAAAMDIQAACTGFIFSLSVAKAYIESNIYKNILVIGSEKLSAFVDYTDRNTCVLFGDGAAAALVSSEGKGFALSGVSLGTDGTQAPLISVPAGGCLTPASEKSVKEKLHCIRMEGREVFKHAVRRMVASINASLQKSNISAEQIGWVVPHQANMRIIDALAKSFSIADERIYKTVHKYGNTSASSIPIALHDLMLNNIVQPGEKILLVAFGAGLTWGSLILSPIEE